MTGLINKRDEEREVGEVHPDVEQVALLKEPSPNGSSESEVIISRQLVVSLMRQYSPHHGTTSVPVCLRPASGRIPYHMLLPQHLRNSDTNAGHTHLPRVQTILYFSSPLYLYRSV